MEASTLEHSASARVSKRLSPNSSNPEFAAETQIWLEKKKKRMKKKYVLLLSSGWGG